MIFFQSIVLTFCAIVLLFMIATEIRDTFGPIGSWFNYWGGNVSEPRSSLTTAHIEKRLKELKPR